MPLALLGLGSNLGEPARQIEDALAQLSSRPGLELVRRSKQYESAPAGGPENQPRYLNAAALVRTSLGPQELLRACQEIENALGRRREVRWGPRTIDIDLLLYDDLTMSTAELQIPHPRMAWRRFVLEPAAEIAPETVHPVFSWPIARLLEHLNSTPWYLAITGPIAVGKTFFSEEVARRTGARLLTHQFLSGQLEALTDNSPFRSRQIEIELILEPARQLARSLAESSGKEVPTVSNFCIEQLVAYALVRLPVMLWPTYIEQWHLARAASAQPRLVAMLHAPPEVLLERIRKRGRYGEEQWTEKQLRQLETTIEKYMRVHEGPIVRIDATDEEAVLTELTAAIEAMR